MFQSNSPFFARVGNKIIFDNKIWDSPLTEDKFISSLTLEMAKAYFTPNNPNSGRVLVGINNLEKFHWKNTYPVPVPNTAQMVETHVTKSMPFLDFFICEIISEYNECKVKSYLILSDKLACIEYESYCMTTPSAVLVKALR